VITLHFPGLPWPAQVRVSVRVSGRVPVSLREGYLLLPAEPVECLCLLCVGVCFVWVGGCVCVYALLFAVFCVMQVRWQRIGVLDASIC
jgi:hypothetical protein